MRTRNHHKSTGKDRIWKCIFVLFVGVQFRQFHAFCAMLEALIFLGGRPSPKNVPCSTGRLKTHKAAFFGRGSPGPAAVGEEFGPKFQAGCIWCMSTWWCA